MEVGRKGCGVGHCNSLTNGMRQRAAPGGAVKWKGIHEKGPIMSLPIPNEREDERLDAEHIEEKDRHAADRIRDEYHEMTDREYREMKEAKRPLEDVIALEEMDVRRQLDVTVGSLTV